jgi:hypothetical protein
MHWLFMHISFDEHCDELRLLHSTHFPAPLHTPLLQAVVSGAGVVPQIPPVQAARAQTGASQSASDKHCTQPPRSSHIRPLLQLAPRAFGVFMQAPEVQVAV